MENPMMPSWPPTSIYTTSPAFQDNLPPSPLCRQVGYSYSHCNTIMTTASVANAGYACGWSVNAGGNWWHQGSLPGTASEDARITSQGKYNFVILTNSRSLSANFVGDLDNLFWSAFPNVTAWPAYDLF